MSWICTVESPHPDGRFLMHPFRMGEAGLRAAGEPIRVHGPTKRGRRRPLAAIDGDELWAATRDRRTSAPALTRIDLSQPTTPETIAPLHSGGKKFPAALTVHERTCYLGWCAEVHAIRFDEARLLSRTVVLRSPGCPDWKPYDILSICPPLMLAVDDIVSPKWRMCIDISNPESPVVVWGHEFEDEQAYAEYFGATSCGGRVMLWSAYGNTYGMGQVLELVAVTQRGISRVADLRMHLGPRQLETNRIADLSERRYDAGAARSDSGFTPKGDEVMGRCGPYRERTLLDRTPFALWTGLASVGNQVFVGAGAQGLLRFQVEDRGFRMLPSLSLGDCLDVAASGSDVVALVRHEGGRRIVQVRPDIDGGLQITAEVAVEERVWRLVGQPG